MPSGYLFPKNMPTKESNVVDFNELSDEDKERVTKPPQDSQASVIPPEQRQLLVGMALMLQSEEYMDIVTASADLISVFYERLVEKELPEDIIVACCTQYATGITSASKDS